MRKIRKVYALGLGAIAALATAGALASGLPSSVSATSETKTYLDKMYTEESSLTDSDLLYKENVKLNTVDGTTGFGVVDGGLNQFLTYKIVTTEEDKYFSSLFFSQSGGRMAYFFGDFGIDFNVYLHTSLDDRGSIVSKTVVKAGQNLTDGLKINLEKAIPTAAKELYVTFGFAPDTPGCGYDTTWNCFQRIVVTGTETALVDGERPVEMADDFSKGTAGVYNAAITGTAGSANGGLVNGDATVTEVTIDAGSLSFDYLIGAVDGVVSKGAFAFKALFKCSGLSTSAVDAAAKANETIVVSYSIDGKAFTAMKIYAHVAPASTDANFAITEVVGADVSTINKSIDLADVIAKVGHQSNLTVRIELKEAAAREISPADASMVLLSANVTGSLAKATYVTYDLAEGTWADGFAPKTIFIASDSDYTLPDPIRAGYDFTGWKDAAGASATVYSPSKGLSASYTASWVLHEGTHSITYNNVPSDVTNTNPTQFTEGDAIITLVDLTRKGYKFLGFYSAETEGEKVTTIDPTTLTADVILYARWEVVSYAITYDLDAHAKLTVTGLTANPASIKYDETITFNVALDEGYYVNALEIDGAKAPYYGYFSIKGSTGAEHTIKIKTAKGQVVNDGAAFEQKFDELAGSDYSWTSNIYAYNNLVVRQQPDVNEGHGLCVNDFNLDTETFVTYAFDAGEGKAFSKFAIAGQARCFTTDAAKDVHIDMYTSTDNATWNKEKEYRQTTPTDGGQKVDLGKDVVLQAASKTLYVKFVFVTPGTNYDWVSLKHFKMVFTANSTGGSSSSAPTSSSPSSSSGSSSSSTSGGSSSKGCGGAIGGTIAASAIALASVVGLLIKRKKEDK